MYQPYWEHMHGHWFYWFRFSFGLLTCILGSCCCSLRTCCRKTTRNLLSLTFNLVRPGWFPYILIYRYLFSLLSSDMCDRANIIQFVNSVWMYTNNCKKIHPPLIKLFRLLNIKRMKLVKEGFELPVQSQEERNGRKSKKFLIFPQNNSARKWFNEVGI